MINPKCECGGTLKIKNHQRWIGYYCPDCKKGGSMQKDKSGNAVTSSPYIAKKKFIREKQMAYRKRVGYHKLPTTPVSNCSCKPGEVYNNACCKVHGQNLPLAPVIEFNPDVINYTKDNLTFSLYLSEMAQVSSSADVLTKGFNLKRPDTGTMMHFQATKVDKNDDEIEGWWYEGVAQGGKICKFLIIND